MPETSPPTAALSTDELPGRRYFDVRCAADGCAAAIEWTYAAPMNPVEGMRRLFDDAIAHGWHLGTSGVAVFCPDHNAGGS